MWRRALLLAGAAALLGARCPDVLVGTDPGRGEVRVLFIGNSLTYGHDVPGLVAGLAQAPGPRLTVGTVAYPNFGLQDHWTQGAARAAIAQGWDLVVLQQGPSALAESRVVLLEYAERFAGEIRAAGARPALYTVWPALARASDFPAVLESYRLAAEQVTGVLLPAGAAWQAVLADDANTPLYGPDAFHAGPAGAYLAALVIWGGITGQSPVGRPVEVTRPDGSRLALDRRLAERLQAAAAAVLSAPATN